MHILYMFSLYYRWGIKFMIHDYVLILSLSLMAFVLFVFIYVAYYANETGDQYAVIQKKSYRIRSIFFWFLLVAGVLILVITTQDLPYASTRGNTDGVDKTVTVNGGQWFWDINESSASLGDTVVFDVKALDVTHGFGVYNPEMKLIGQTQAMPGYKNSLKITFEEPGVYKLLCMEYCGIAHHAMISEFTVSQ